MTEEDFTKEAHRWYETVILAMTATRVFIFLEVHVRKRGLLGGLVDFFLCGEGRFSSGCKWFT